MMSFFSVFPTFMMPRSRKIALREQFLDSVHAATTPLSPREDSALAPRLLRTRSGGAVELCLAFRQKNLNLEFELKQKDHIIISRMVSQSPGRGHGDEAMEFLKAEADALNVSLAMFAEPIAHKSMPMDGLRRWLAGHGFQKLGQPHTLYIRDPGGIDHSPAAAP